MKPNTSLQTHPRPVVAHWTGVFFDGPQSDRNFDGDEIPVWFVYVGDADAAPVGKVYSFHDYYAAAGLSKRIARDRRLELISEAMPA